MVADFDFLFLHLFRVPHGLCVRVLRGLSGRCGGDFGFAVSFGLFGALGLLGGAGRVGASASPGVALSLLGGVGISGSGLAFGARVLGKHIEGLSRGGVAHRRKSVPVRPVRGGDAPEVRTLDGVPVRVARVVSLSRPYTSATSPRSSRKAGLSSGIMEGASFRGKCRPDRRASGHSPF